MISGYVASVGLVCQTPSFSKATRGTHGVWFYGKSWVNTWEFSLVYPGIEVLETLMSAKFMQEQLLFLFSGKIVVICPRIRCSMPCKEFLGIMKKATDSWLGEQDG